MKDFISTALLRELAAFAQEPCASIYLPTHFAGAEVRQDEPRLDALLARAEQQLAARGLRSTVARDLTLAARARATHPRFWHDRSRGLALFFSSSFERQLRMAEPVAESVHVANHFYLRPLLPFALPSDRFYVLGVNQQHPRLWRGNQVELVELEVPGMPVGLADVLHEVSHQGALARSGQPNSLYHGQGARRQTYDADLERYLRQLNEAVGPALAGEQAPLVLAGDGAIVAAYRRVQDYSRVAPEVVTGSVDRLSPHTLHEQAWTAALGVIEAPRRLALARRSELMGTALATEQPAEMLRAAYEGRVDTLFASGSAELFGRSDAQQGSVDLSFQARPGDEDLVNRLLLETLRHGGSAYAVDSSCSLSALLRY